MRDCQKLRLSWLAPASSRCHLARGLLLNGRRTEATEAALSPGTVLPRWGCDSRAQETKGCLRHQEKILMRAGNGNSGGEVLISRRGKEGGGLPVFIRSHQPKWGAASAVHTPPLIPGPAPSATEAGCTLSPFHPLSSWASSSFLSLDTHKLRFHNPFWAPLDPSVLTGGWSFFVCFWSPPPSPCALSLFPARLSYAGARPAACHPFINAFQL